MTQKNLQMATLRQASSDGVSFKAEYNRGAAWVGSYSTTMLTGGGLRGKGTAPSGGKGKTAMTPG